MMTDPIADMLTRIRNAMKVEHETLDVPFSKLKLGVVDVLKREGYIWNYEVSYCGPKDLQPVLNGLGISILSTNKGVVSDREAREQNVGGEVLCEIW